MSQNDETNEDIEDEEKEDYDIIYDIISKHFFLQTLTHQAKEEINMINEFSPNPQDDQENQESNPQFQINNIFSKDNEDNEEIEYVMQSMERLRLNHQDSFEFVINTTKEVLDIINKKELKGRDLIKKLDSLFKEVEKIKEIK